MGGIGVEGFSVGESGGVLILLGIIVLGFTCLVL